MPPDPAQSQRLFIGCFFSTALQQTVVNLQTQLKALTPGWRISWIPAANIHLTLKFLGNVSGEQQTLLETWLEQQPKPAPFEIHFGQYGAFPNWKTPQVLYLHIIEASGYLAQFANHLNVQLESLGFKQESRPYHPHLTLGRVRRRGEVFAEPQVPSIQSEPIDDFALVKSESLSTEPCYTVLKNYFLGV